MTEARIEGSRGGRTVGDEEVAVGGTRVVVPSPHGGSARAAVSPLPEAAWREALSRTEHPVLTQTPRWLRCLESATSWRGSGRLYELSGGRFLVLPMVSRGAGPFRLSASWPHGWGYGGVLASDGVVTPADLALVGADLAATPGLRTTVVPSPFAPQRVPAFPGAKAEHHHLTQVLDLSGGTGAVWRGYSSNVRRSVKRAEREGVEVHRDATGGALPEFAHLYRLSAVRWARNAGRPAALGRLQARLQEPPRLLEAVSRVVGEDLVTWTAYVGGRAAASVVILHGDGHSLMWRGAQDQQLAGRTHANALLHHLAIEEAVARGSRLYSFGESDPGSSLAEYKAKFGSVDHTWSAYSFERLPVSTGGAAALRAYRSASALAGRGRGKGRR
ncbi:GNAT family N-acetyltransferase [Paenibacillus sp. TRM 82003]|uniref:GNAT family N-acetyltransferase n=1 Tax=Kineococcus sp. TRM81007 TaxID=2925831 RepID=UPI001F5A716D|nr:GNAT family N-acetyltransferase [Kineococcus sp. TRM81007]MCI2239732.1 GNAT family N-acetyltransferase [Kineococcus sp. TRM81007]MCI3926705.1 GNAT family N-acetyltransferase [Paenibacillus sp. TRM 82003]